MTNNTIDTKQQQLTVNHAYDWVTHEVQLYTFSISQQSKERHHFLVRVGPDNLLTYFTMFWELIVTFIQLQKSFYCS